MNTTRNRINAWADLRTADHVATGKTWYRTAHEFARTVSDRYDIHIARVVGVLSVLSVQNRWEVNKRDCEAMCRAHADGEDLEQVTVATYPSQKGKAIAILTTGCDIRETIGTKWAGKTRAFYANILNPYDPGPVTIDRWILRGLDFNRTIYPALYNRIADDIRAIADERGMLPHELQAAIWVCIQDVARLADWDDSRPGPDGDDIPLA